MAGRFGYPLPYSTVDTSGYDLARTVVDAATRAGLERRERKRMEREQQQQATQDTAINSSIAAIVAGADPNRIAAGNPNVIGDPRFGNAMSLAQAVASNQRADNAETARQSHLAALTSGADPQRIMAANPSLLGDEQAEAAVKLGARPEPEPVEAPDFTMVNGMPYMWNQQTGRLELAPGIEAPSDEGPEFIQATNYHNPETGESRTVNTRQTESALIAQGWRQGDYRTGTQSQAQKESGTEADRLMGVLDSLRQPTRDGRPLFEQGTRAFESLKPGVLQSQDRKSYEANMTAMSNAVVSLMPGTATDEDVARVKREITPMVNDGPQVLEQKWNRAVDYIEAGLKNAGMSNEDIAQRLEPYRQVYGGKAPEEGGDNPYGTTSTDELLRMARERGLM